MTPLLYGIGLENEWVWGWLLGYSSLSGANVVGAPPSSILFTGSDTALLPHQLVHCSVSPEMSTAEDAVVAPTLLLRRSMSFLSLLSGW